MKQYDHVFGVDVSKRTVDITHVINQQFTHRQFTNNEAGMEQLMQWLKELAPAFDKTLFCMESTGLYCFTLTHFLASHSIDTWIEHAAQIKKATALARGKNDKVDSQRIAMYATKYLDRLRLWKPVNATLEKIRHLASLRERLVDTKKRLTIPIKEFEDVGNLWQWLNF
jgi:transposase